MLFLPHRKHSQFHGLDQCCMNIISAEKPLVLPSLSSRVFNLAMSLGYCLCSILHVHLSETAMHFLKMHAHGSVESKSDCVFWAAVCKTLHGLIAKQLRLHNLWSCQPAMRVMMHPELILGTGYEVGIHPEWDTSPWNDITHTHIHILKLCKCSK